MTIIPPWHKQCKICGDVLDIKKFKGNSRAGRAVCLDCEGKPRRKQTTLPSIPAREKTYLVLPPQEMLAEESSPQEMLAEESSPQEDNQPSIPGKICKRCLKEKNAALFDAALFPERGICNECDYEMCFPPEGMKYCLECFACITQREYKTNKSRCKECQRKRRKATYNAEEARDRNYRNNYGITLEEYNLMFFQQAGLCAVCNQSETFIDPYTKQVKYLAVDHNHETDKVRQLLCTTCNQLLGHLEKDPGRVKKLITYLEKHEGI